MAEPTIEAVWDMRTGRWHVRGPSPEWRVLHGHHSADASDLELLAAASAMWMPADVRGAHLRRLEPAWRLPKSS